MFKFVNEQKIFEIGGVKIGGDPGKLPTVMIGSIFYHGDKLVKDEKEGIFEKNKAELFWLNSFCRILKKTNNSNKACLVYIPHATMSSDQW